MVGVATAGFGTTAWVFAIPLGLYDDYKIGDWAATAPDGYGCPDCGSVFVSPSLSTRVRGVVGR